VENPNSSQYCQKVIKKHERPPQSHKKSAPKTAVRQQTVFKARLKLLTQNFISCKIAAMSGNSKVIMSLKITHQQKITSILSDLASAHYAKDTLARIEELKGRSIVTIIGQKM
jgi:hypothetical protein